jgi:hypothetical protein
MCGRGYGPHRSSDNSFALRTIDFPAQSMQKAQKRKRHRFYRFCPKGEKSWAHLTLAGPGPSCQRGMGGTLTINAI